MKNPRKTSEICENEEEAHQEEEITAAETETFQKILRSPSLKRFLSEDDADSFVSAESVSNKSRIENFKMVYECLSLSY